VLLFKDGHEISKMPKFNTDNDNGITPEKEREQLQAASVFNSIDRGLTTQPLISQEIQLTTLSVFTRHRDLSNSEFELAKCLNKLNILEYPGHDVGIDDLRAGLRTYTADYTRLIFNDLTALPGFNSLEKVLLVAMTTRSIFPLYGGVVHSRFFIGNEYFRQVFSGIQMTFRSMERLVSGLSEPMRDFFSALQCLRLSDQEASLVLPFIVTLALRGL
jgi:hypothetical protein